MSVISKIKQILSELYGKISLPFSKLKIKKHEDKLSNINESRLIVFMN